ncbi:MAG: MmcQ/YjbR family DNA-binding protein [Schleiferiaceae bacterium]|jgi:predicted DNA-binding protein (MmcQ/YjbR family)|nr:MmcQ/YjbR family DNA-binding protein [Schleiferiaceae bacterium]
MNVEEFRLYCLNKRGVTESFPFDESTLVFKVMNKMFALTGLNAEDFRVNLKCDPEKALELREEFDYVLPGYHMSKKHWNTIICEFATDIQIKSWTDDSYQLIVASLPKKIQAELNELTNGHE